MLPPPDDSPQPPYPYPPLFQDGSSFDLTGTNTNEIFVQDGRFAYRPLDSALSAEPSPFPTSQSSLSGTTFPDTTLLTAQYNQSSVTLQPPSMQQTPLLQASPAQSPQPSPTISPTPASVLPSTGVQLYLPQPPLRDNSTHQQLLPQTPNGAVNYALPFITPHGTLPLPQNTARTAAPYEGTHPQLPPLTQTNNSLFTLPQQTAPQNIHPLNTALTPTNITQQTSDILTQNDTKPSAVQTLPSHPIPSVGMGMNTQTAQTHTIPSSSASLTLTPLYQNPRLYALTSYTTKANTPATSAASETGNTPSLSFPEPGTLPTDRHTLLTRESAQTPQHSTRNTSTARSTNTSRSSNSSEAGSFRANLEWICFGRFLYTPRMGDLYLQFGRKTIVLRIFCPPPSDPYAKDSLCIPYRLYIRGEYIRRMHIFRAQDTTLQRFVEQGFVALSNEEALTAQHPELSDFFSSRTRTRQDVAVYYVHLVLSQVPIKQIGHAFPGKNYSWTGAATIPNIPDDEFGLSYVIRVKCKADMLEEAAEKFASKLRSTQTFFSWNSPS